MDKSNGNAFKDLDLPNSDQSSAKAKLHSFIQSKIQEYNLANYKVADIVGLSTATVGDVMRSKTHSFSINRLIVILAILKYDITITVNKTPSKKEIRGSLDVDFK